MNKVEIEGGITNVTDWKPLFDRYVCDLTVAVSDVRYNSQQGRDEIVSTFWAVSWWADSFEERNMLAKGDKVYVMGSLGQSAKKPGQEGPSHTRIFAKQVIIVRGSKAGRELRSEGSSTPPAQNGAPATDDPPF